MIFILHRPSTATVYWDECQSESDYPPQFEGDYYNLCILDELFKDRSHSWKFTQATIKETTFRNCAFQNKEEAPNNFTDAIWENVVFEGCTFGSIDVKYGPRMVFDHTSMVNVRFENTLFHHSVELVFDRFKMDNVTFSNCSFTGNTVFSLGTMNAVTIEKSKFVHNVETMTAGNNESLIFKQVTINTMNLIDNEFVHPIKFEALDAADVSFNKTKFGEFFCHGFDDEGEVSLRTQFNDTSFDSCFFRGKVVCDETTWRGFYAGNVTFFDDADFSKSKITDIAWHTVKSAIDENDPECKVLNFSQSYVLRKTLSDITIDCDASFEQTKFEKVLVSDFFAKNANFDSAEFIKQEYIDGECCTTACRPLLCKCNVTDPSGSCPTARYPVNASLSKPTCFPGDATVRNVGGEVITMEQLALNEKIAIGNGKHSDIYFFGHRDSEEDTEFIKLSHNAQHQKPLKLSASHYLYVNGLLRTAGSVVVGDVLRGENGNDDLIVMDVEKVEGKGVYAPTSLHGDLLVDGVIVSSYTDAIHPTTAHRLLHPLRLLYRAGWYRLVSRFTIFERRSWDDVARFLNIPQGPAVVKQ